MAVKPCIVLCPIFYVCYIVMACFSISDVLKGEYNGLKVAVKSLKDSSKAAQQFLAEASVMT